MMITSTNKTKTKGIIESTIILTNFTSNCREIYTININTIMNCNKNFHSSYIFFGKWIIKEGVVAAVATTSQHIDV
jgi:hypothetical protein